MSMNTTTLDPREMYRKYGSLSLDELREKVGELLSRGITIKCGDEPVHFQTSYIIKSGKFKDIYMLNQLTIGEGDSSRVYEADDYILKVRFMNNTDEYWTNEGMTFPDRGSIPLEMSEGHRYSLISGEIAKLFARVIPLKSYILMQTYKYVVDFIIQERMTTSLDILRRNAQLSPSMIFCFMYRMLDMVRMLSSMNYTFTNFSPSSVMLKASKEGWSLKLMNLSFLQRDGDIQIGTNDKLLVTASLNQLRGDVSSSNSNMLWNVIFTVFDLFRPKSYLENVRGCCMNDECVLTKLYQNRRAEINEYMESKSDNEAIVTIQRLINAVRSSNPLQEMMNILEGYNSSSNRIVHDLVLTLIARKMLFNDPGDANYESMNPYTPSCDVENMETSISGIRNLTQQNDSDYFYPSSTSISGIRNLTQQNDSDYFYSGDNGRTRSTSIGSIGDLKNSTKMAISGSSTTADGIRNLTQQNDSDYFYPSSTSISGIRNLTQQNDSDYFYSGDNGRTRSTSIGSIGDLKNSTKMAISGSSTTADGIRNLTQQNDSDYFYPSSTSINGIRNLTQQNDSDYFYPSSTSINGIRNLTQQNDSDYFYPPSTLVSGIRNLTQQNDSDYFYSGDNGRTRSTSIGSIGDLKNSTKMAISGSSTTADGSNLTRQNDEGDNFNSSYNLPQFIKPSIRNVNHTVFNGAPTRDILHMLERRIRKLENQNK